MVISCIWNCLFCYFWRRRCPVRDILSARIHEVYDHDFPSYGDGSIVPNAIFDSKLNEAYVTLEISKDTSEFWCDCFRQWWKTYGIKKTKRKLSMQKYKL